jgi:hypothetical protein
MAKSVDTKGYREYLDKEMSIMGILSAFSVLAAGGVLSAVMGSDKGAACELWKHEPLFIVVGAALCVLAASFFYKQRSDLAYYYGQICLVEALQSRDVQRAKELLEEADSWATWWAYSLGFTFLISGFLGFGLSLLFFVSSPHPFYIKSFQGEVECCVLFVGVLISCNIARLQYYVLKQYKDKEDYWEAYRQGPLNFWRRPKSDV